MKIIVILLIFMECITAAMAVTNFLDPVMKFKKHLVLKEEDSFFNQSTDTICQCKTICIIDIDCSLFSWMKLDTNFQCLITRKRPTVELELIESSTGGSGVIADPEPYMVPSTDSDKLFTFDAAKTYCEKNYVGYYLGMYKTEEQLADLLRIWRQTGYDQIWVNMFTAIVDGVKVPQWADGTLFSETELRLKMAKHTVNDEDEGFPMRLKNDSNVGRYVFNDRPKTYEFNFVCQRRNMDNLKRNQRN